jgi:predicted DNA-binding transcriptional regulator AlpA
MASNSEFITTRELARLLGVSRQTLYNWIAAGKIPEPRRHPTTGMPRWRPDEVETLRAMIVESRQAYD